MTCLLALVWRGHLSPIDLFTVGIDLVEAVQLMGSCAVIVCNP